MSRLTLISMMTNYTIFHEYFPTLTNEQYLRLEAYAQLLRSWNERINLISRKDTQALLFHHIGHSLALLRYHSLVAPSLVLDLGTGGGFPGIPLAIACPEVEFHLVDSIAKKVRAVDDMVSQLELRNVRVLHARAEELTTQTYDCVVTRGVATLMQLWMWSYPLLKRNTQAVASGLFAYKGFPFTEEGEIPNTKTKVIPLKGLLCDEFFDSKSIVQVLPQ